MGRPRSRDQTDCPGCLLRRSHPAGPIGSLRVPTHQVGPRRRATKQNPRRPYTTDRKNPSTRITDAHHHPFHFLLKKLFVFKKLPPKFSLYDTPTISSLSVCCKCVVRTLVGAPTSAFLQSRSVKLESKVGRSFDSSVVRAHRPRYAIIFSSARTVPISLADFLPRLKAYSGIPTCVGIELIDSRLRDFTNPKPQESGKVVSYLFRHLFRLNPEDDAGSTIPAFGNVNHCFSPPYISFLHTAENRIKSAEASGARAGQQHHFKHNDFFVNVPKANVGPAAYS